MFPTHNVLPLHEHNSLFSQTHNAWVLQNRNVLILSQHDFFEPLIEAPSGGISLQLSGIQGAHPGGSLELNLSGRLLARRRRRHCQRHFVLVPLGGP